VSVAKFGYKAGRGARKRSSRAAYGGFDMVNARPGRLQEDGQKALLLMEQALQLLDRCDPALDVGAHLDLAICRLRERLQPGSGALEVYEAASEWSDPKSVPSSGNS
jgi:hypothetical protein